MNMNEIARILPFKYNDKVTGDKIEISVSPQYSKLKINEREYFFIRETGKFDGTGMPVKDQE